MYILNLKIVHKNPDGCKKLKKLSIERCDSLEQVITESADFLKVLSIPDDIISEYLSKTTVVDLDTGSILKFKYYTKDLNSNSLKIEIDITKTI